MSQCEKILRSNYSLNEDDELIISKYDLNNNESQITVDTNEVEFTIYDMNGRELNKSLCNNTDITISYPINKRSGIKYTFGYEMKNDSIDVFNPEDEFFNDFCYSYSLDGKDITLDDRRESIYVNDSLCKQGCQYISINYTTEKVNCFITLISISFLSVFLKYSKTYENKKMKNFLKIFKFLKFIEKFLNRV